MQRNLLYFALLLYCVASQDDYCYDVRNAENPSQKAFEMALDANTNSRGVGKDKNLCRIIRGVSTSACDAYAIYSDDEGEHWSGLNWNGEEQDGATGCLGTKGNPWSQDRQHAIFYDSYFMAGYCGCSGDYEYGKTLGDNCGFFDINKCVRSGQNKGCGANEEWCILDGPKECDNGLVCGLTTDASKNYEYNLHCRGCINDQECGNGKYCDLEDIVVGNSFPAFDDMKECYVLGLDNALDNLLELCNRQEEHPFHDVSSAFEYCDFVVFNPGKCKNIDVINCRRAGKRNFKMISSSSTTSSSNGEKEMTIMKHIRDGSKLYHGDKYCKIIPGVASSKCDEYAVYSDNGESSWKGLNWDGEEQQGATGCLGLKTNPWSEQEKQDYYLKYYHYGICGCNNKATNSKTNDGKEEGSNTGETKKKGQCPKGNIKLSKKKTKIEFENFSNAYDVESKNLGSHSYKGDKHGVDLKDVGENIIVVSHIRNGEWLEYKLDASKFDKRDGFYIQFNYARKSSSTIKVHVLRNEDEVGSYEFSNTGSWATHIMSDEKAIYVRGNDSCITLRFEFEGEKVNLDYFIIHV
jgi:hypothetical protein